MNTELIKYINDNILPEYQKNDIGHGIGHINTVVKRSLEFAKQCNGINPDMVYTIACYHDIGHHIDAKNHEKVSADIFRSDKNMRQFFDDNQIKTIAEAIEDHRASNSNEPRSIYGKIVSSADRKVDIDETLICMYNYRLAHSYSNNLEDIIIDSFNHCNKKFGKDGYAVHKIYFGEQEYKDYLRKLSEISSNYETFKKAFIKANHLKIDD